MATITKRQRESGVTYQVKIRMAGGNTSATFRKLADARAWAAQTETAIHNGTYFEAQPARKHTLGELIVRYLASPAFEKIKEQDTRRAHLGGWRAQCGRATLAKLTSEKIAAGRDKLRAAGTAPATANMYLTALSKALRLAVGELGWIESNPCSWVGKFKEANARDRVLTDAEYQRLLDACRSQEVRDLIILGRFTAARRGELTGLRRGGVDLKCGLVHLTDTKNGDSRGVAPVDPALEAMGRRMNVPRLDTALLSPQGRDPANFGSRSL